MKYNFAGEYNYKHDTTYQFFACYIDNIFLVKYQNGEISIDVNFDYEKETIWLSQAQIAELFEVDRTRITRYINNILQEGELDDSTCAENAHMGNNGKQQYKTMYYNLNIN